MTVYPFLATFTKENERVGTMSGDRGADGAEVQR